MSAIAKEPSFEIAYLGPEGTYAHSVAKQRFSKGTHKLIPCGSVAEVFDYLKQHKHTKGVVPIENSSGGMIVPTIDGLIENACKVFIEEELSIDVKLAFMSKKGRKIERVYSHHAPLHHCDRYLKKHYPGVKAIPCDSTASASKEAVKDKHGAAIGSIDQADIYGLEVLEYPIMEEIQNVTQFFVVSHTKREAGEGQKTSFVVALPDYAGSLFDFLKPFADAKVSLKRIESRPVIGHPNTYNFLVEVEGTEKDKIVASALKLAEKVSVSLHNLGSYPVCPQFQS